MPSSYYLKKKCGIFTHVVLKSHGMIRMPFLSENERTVKYRW